MGLRPYGQAGRIPPGPSERGVGGAKRIGVPGSITTKGLAVPGFSQWGVSCGKGSPAAANGGGRAAHSLPNGEGGTWERVAISSFPVWPVGGERGGRGGRKEGQLGGLQAGNLQRARSSRTCARMLLSYDPGIREPRVTYRAGLGNVRGGARLVFVDECWTPCSLSSVCGLMESRVAVHAGAVGSGRGRGDWEALGLYCASADRARPPGGWLLRLRCPPAPPTAPSSPSSTDGYISQRGAG